MTALSFDGFRQEWLEEIVSGSPSTIELGRRFATKILTQWAEVDDSSDDLIYCDGAGDGGIDIAYLHRGEGGEAEGGQEVQPDGHTWYLVQSKYGSAFRGSETLLQEAQKVIDTLDGQRARLSSLTEALLERLVQFRRNASERDRIVLVFAAEDSLNDEQKRVLNDIRAMGRNRLGTLFDVESVSIETIYLRTLDETSAAMSRVRVPIKASVVPSGVDLLVGSISLLSLYDFLKAYRNETEDLDQLYEKNVRRFLGNRGKVNKAMEKTLQETPELFGLYNNGITVVVSDFTQNEGGIVELVEPYVVNGCQTTRTIWEVCHKRLEAGGTGTDPRLLDWRHRAGEGVVVAKIVKVGIDNEAQLQSITRYTNTQNAVREKDFLALTSDFRSWARQMEDVYGVYLEIQRGGWESRRALQRQMPNLRQLTEYANSFDLLKVYGAGWLGEAGRAFGSNRDFLPNGIVFKRILKDDPDGEAFSVEDLYAAYRLQKAADGYRFGRTADKASRRQTRYLFYIIVIQLLKDAMVRDGLQTSAKDLTSALNTLFKPENEDACKALLDTAIEVVDEYLTQGKEETAFEEPKFKNEMNSDLNAFLKWEQLGKSPEGSPCLLSLIGGYQRIMGMGRGQSSSRDVILRAIRQRP